MTTRKPHVHVDQDALLEALRETGGGELPTIAEHFDVSEGSARHKLDGLVVQGKLRVVPAERGRFHRWYEPI